MPMAFALEAGVGSAAAENGRGESADPVRKWASGGKSGAAADADGNREPGVVRPDGIRDTGAELRSTSIWAYGGIP